MSNSNHSWMRRLALLATLSSFGCAGASTTGSETENATQDDSALFVVSTVVWPSPTIPVCWLNVGPEHAQAKQWTRDAVASTWEAVSRVRFVGWQDCNGENNGVRISVGDVRPNSALGVQATWGKPTDPSMWLNFTFDTWSPVCQDSLEKCIQAIAPHEFGHALGFDHEQNRPDSPDWCASDTQVSGDTVIGPWDTDSVMNYCNPEWNGDGTLSLIDIQGVQQVYGAPDGSACGEMTGGQGLDRDRGLASCDGRFLLVMQGDGNLVLYQEGKPLWGTGTQNTGGNFAVMQGDGNFVLYDTSGKALWASGTAGHPGARLVVQNDGNLVVYANDSKPLWGSNTCCH